MSRPQSDASKNLKQAIGGLVQIAVQLTHVLEVESHQWAALHASQSRDVDELTSRVSAMGLGQGVAQLPREEVRRTVPPQTHDQKMYLKEDSIPTKSLGKWYSSISQVPGNPQLEDDADPEARHYAVFCGSDVGVVGDWSVVCDWTFGVPWSRQRGYKTRAGAVREFGRALDAGRVKRVNTSADPRRPTIEVITRAEHFGENFRPLGLDAHLAQRNGRRGPASTVVMSTMCSSPKLSEEQLYGLDDSPEFDRLCMEAVDAFEASQRSVSGSTMTTSTPTSTTVTPSSASTSSTELSDEQVYGLDDSPEFDRLCMQAVDEFEASCAASSDDGKEEFPGLWRD